MNAIKKSIFYAVTASIFFLGGCLKYSKKRTYFTNKSDNRETHGVRVYRYLGFSK